MSDTPDTRASRRAAVAPARSVLRRPAIGIAAGLVLAAVAATGLLAAPALAAPTDADLRKASVTEHDGRIALRNAVSLNEIVAASEIPGTDALAAVDIADLKKDVADLADRGELTADELADRTDDVVRRTVIAQRETVALQNGLTAAKEAEEARIAAEKARIAAEKAAEEKRRAAAALAAANTVDGAKATARRMASDRYGWGEGQFSCLASLWTKESGWNYQAYNSGSGATGIPQSLPGSKMATAGADWRTNAATQISWGLDYIKRAYGTPCAAWSHSQAVNWY
ncbi:phospholipase [Microbacterium sp. YJN-G]|uniref:aggregation-promoting factor C-terminal-like domain-containing protein n=1 Tax=Microbacterium sp. YJN-G TaxID=2763257 RepID=UPI0018780835|nr:phospholipase [Microbacterium sp. YJN-G]